MNSERSNAREAQRVDMTFPQMSIIMSLTHMNTNTRTGVKIADI